jgi:putative endonuclease
MALARSIAGLFSRCGSWTSRWTEPENAAHALGRRGEKLAARYLRQRGYKVLYRNFRAPRGGEVDLVCRHGNELVFVEVKTRSGTEFGRPLEAVGSEKQRLIARGAIAWLRMLDDRSIVYRFDVVEVVVGEVEIEITLVQDAFTLPEPWHM